MTALPTIARRVAAMRHRPKSMQAAHRFLLAGTENREWVALQAYRGNVPWEYSIPLSSVVAYLRWRGPALE